MKDGMRGREGQSLRSALSLRSCICKAVAEDGLYTCEDPNGVTGLSSSYFSTYFRLSTASYVKSYDMTYANTLRAVDYNVMTDSWTGCCMLVMPDIYRMKETPRRVTTGRISICNASARCTATNKRRPYAQLKGGLRTYPPKPKDRKVAHQCTSRPTPR